MNSKSLPTQQNKKVQFDLINEKVIIVIERKNASWKTMATMEKASLTKIDACNNSKRIGYNNLKKIGYSEKDALNNSESSKKIRSSSYVKRMEIVSKKKTVIGKAVIGKNVAAKTGKMEIGIVTNVVLTTATTKEVAKIGTMEEERKTIIRIMEITVKL